ncbi:MAG: TonB-dependent receptor [Alphaproteobacteria bacterium]|nr:TonB-dependent receptor [Alphaproteobacteria bacterium]
MTKKDRFVLSLMLGTSLTAVANSVVAQGRGTQSGVVLEEIVVTAQKREENLQQVPFAVSAISAETIEKLAIRDARDISGMAPNVTIVQGTVSNSAAVISMRGIPNGGSESFGLDLANGLYVDGVYIARSGASGLDVMDVERIEVLRGPQGTLFGRNTTGGAVAFVSRQPSQEFQARAEVGGGNFDTRHARISLDPGNIMGVATSFSYIHRERDGTVDNILQAESSNDPGARETDSFRGAARAELADTGSIQYIFDWSKTDGIAPAFQLTNTSNGAVRPPLVINGKAVRVTQPAPVAQYLAGATFLEAGCAALAAPTRAYRDRVCNDIPNTATDKTWGHNLQVQNDFDAFSVKSTTGYRFWNSSYNTDLDGLGAFTGPAFTQATLFNRMPAALLGFVPTIPAAARPVIASSPVPTIQQNLFDTNNVRRHKQFSQEVEISGDTDAFDWVAGAFYFWERGSERNPQNSGFVLDTNNIFLGNFGPLGPSFVAANPARYRLVQTRAVLAYIASSESTATYAQTTFYPGGRDSGLRLTAGGRYTWDEKTMRRSQNGAVPLAVLESGDASFDKFTWNLMAAYDVAENANVYARVATGYRSGGYNSQDPVIPGTTQPANFNPESVISYELGLKSELFDRRLRLNVAGFHNVYSDLAVNIPRTDAPLGTFATRVGNAGKVTYTGFEVEGQAILSESFNVEGNIGYIDVKFKEFLVGQSTTAGAPPIDIASVNRPGYTSPLTAYAALNAQFPFGGDLRLVGRVSYTYEDGKYTFPNNIGAPFNDELRGNNRNIVDAQIGVDGISVSGAAAEVRLWVKNLTNQHDFVRGIDFGQLGYAGGFFADPRTYGLTAGIKF